MSPDKSKLSHLRKIEKMILLPPNSNGFTVEQKQRLQANLQTGNHMKKNFNNRAMNILYTFHLREANISTNLKLMMNGSFHQMNLKFKMNKET